MWWDASAGIEQKCHLSLYVESYASYQIISVIDYAFHILHLGCVMCHFMPSEIFSKYTQIIWDMLRSLHEIFKLLIFFIIRKRDRDLCRPSPLPFSKRHNNITRHDGWHFLARSLRQGNQVFRAEKQSLGWRFEPFGVSFWVFRSAKQSM